MEIAERVRQAFAAAEKERGMTDDTPVSMVLFCSDRVMEIAERVRQAFAAAEKERGMTDDTPVSMVLFCSDRVPECGDVIALAGTHHVVWSVAPSGVIFTDKAYSITVKDRLMWRYISRVDGGDCRKVVTEQG